MFDKNKVGTPPPNLPATGQPPNTSNDNRPAEAGALPPKNNTPQPPQVEDIFAGTETGVPPSPSKNNLSGLPKTTAPETASAPNPVDDIFIDPSVSSGGFGRWLKIMLIVVVLVALAGGGWWAFAYFYPQWVENRPVNTNVGSVNTNANSNTDAGNNSNGTGGDTEAPTTDNGGNNQHPDRDRARAEGVPEDFDLDSDSDLDGLMDWEEIYIYGTDPNKGDTDGDGLSDNAEINIYGTDPLNADTDGDGFSDGSEVINGYDPLDSSAGARLYGVPQ